jgi:hypothetical protein
MGTGPALGHQSPALTRERSAAHPIALVAACIILAAIPRGSQLHPSSSRLTRRSHGRAPLRINHAAFGVTSEP